MLFQKLWRSLKLTESEDDEHADTIRDVLCKPEFDVNIHKRQYSCRPGALHVACGYKIRSHVGAQLLLSDERCDVNLQDDGGGTALMETVVYVRFDDDKYAKILRLLLAHQSIDVNISDRCLRKNCTTQGM